jgi:hypothetical protein
VTPRTQTILAERPDGHSAAGLPGNCLQTAVASLLELEVDQVPHFALYVDWFAAMRRWARDRGGDFTYFPFPVPEEHAEAWASCQRWGREHSAYVILGGPSPRGPFGHVVVGTVDLETVHDPHPSRAGITAVEDAILYCQPYDPPPVTLELTA